MLGAEVDEQCMHAHRETDLAVNGDVNARPFVLGAELGMVENGVELTNLVLGAHGGDLPRHRQYNIERYQSSVGALWNMTSKSIVECYLVGGRIAQRHPRRID